MNKCINEDSYLPSKLRIYLQTNLLKRYHRLAQNRCYDVGMRTQFSEAKERDHWPEMD